MEVIAVREDRLDVLVNSAGLMISQPPQEPPLEAWDGVLNTNLRGAFPCIKMASLCFKRCRARQ